MNTSSAGRRAEYIVRDIFERAEFTVIRAAASKGIADLIALRAGPWIAGPTTPKAIPLVEVIAISVKAGKSWPGTEERTRMREALPLGATLLIVRVPKIRKGTRRIGMRTPPPDWRILDDHGYMGEIPPWLRAIVEPQGEGLMP